MNGVRHTRKLNQQRCNSTAASSGSGSSKSATTTTAVAKRGTSSIVDDSLRHESPNTGPTGPSPQHRNLRSITRAASSASSTPDSPGLTAPSYVPPESPTLVTGSRKRKQLASRRSTQTPSTIDPNIICDGGRAEDGPGGMKSRRTGESSGTNDELSLLALASSATASRPFKISGGSTISEHQLAIGQPSAEVVDSDHKKASMKREHHRLQKTQHHGHQPMPNHYNAHSVTSTSHVIEPDSSISSVESVRDRSHLTLDFKEMKPRSNSINQSTSMAINPLLLAVAAAAAAAQGQGDGSGAASSNSGSSGHSSVSSANTTPNATLTNTVTPIGADSTVSPLSLPKELLESIVLSPDKFLNLPTSFLAAAVAQHQSHLQKQGAAQISVPLETPTPTRLLNPKNVTKAQETFAEGFLHALQKVQSENRFAPPTQVAASSAVHSPSAVKLATESESVSSTTAGTNKDLLTVDTAQGGVGGSKAGSFSSKSSPNSRAIEAEGLLLAELLKLDPNNSKGYMDLFPHYQNQRPSQASSISPGHYQPLQGATTSSTGHFSHSPPELSLGHGQGMGQQAYGHHSPGMGFQPPPMIGRHTHQRSSSQMSMASAAMAGADMMSPQGMGGGYPGSSRSLSNGREFDPEEQERRKLERKRARNRMAATKCRQRKLEKITELEGVVAEEQARGQAKQHEIDTLRQTVRDLSAELQRHRNAGCNLGGGHGGRAYK